MITASQQYMDALKHSHESVIRVTAYDGGVEIGELSVIDLSLALDSKADIQRNAEIRVAVDPLNTETRDTLEALSVQYGEVVIEHSIRGVQEQTFFNPEWVQLARLRIDSIEWTTTQSYRTIKAFDRALLLQEHKFPTARPLNDTYTNLITTMLQETLPGETLTIDPGISTSLTPTAGKVFGRGDNRLRRIQEMAAALGAWLINDPDGGFRLTDWPETGVGVWTISEGDEGVLLDADQVFSRREQYNAVGIEFTPADKAADFSAFVYLWDNDPTSPTYYDGPFGKRNLFFTEEYDHLPSITEAETVARRKLLETSGATRGVELSAVYNPLLLPGDRIDVKIPDQAIETHVCEMMSINFGTSAAMQIETRLDRDIATIGGLS